MDRPPLNPPRFPRGATANNYYGQSQASSPDTFYGYNEKKLPTRPSHSRRRWLWCGAGLVLVIVLALAIGLGVGLSHRHSSSPSSTPTPTTTPVNPVKITSTPQLIGNVSSDTTQNVRDLGYQGQVGSIWINTFGDTVPCKQGFPTQISCFGLVASNSAGIMSNETQYTDIQTNGSDQFCPRIDGEVPGFGVGVTNVVPMNSDESVIFTVASNRKNQKYSSAGAGVAKVTIANGQPLCSRDYGAWWWNLNTEPRYGDHGAVLGQDGYIYALGASSLSKAPGSSCPSCLWLARVPQADATSLSSYEYWNGNAFTSQRLYNATAEQSVLQAYQGSIIWSEFYQMYLYFTVATYMNSMLVHAAHQPNGPWSDPVTVFTTSNNPDKYPMYGPVVQPRFSSSDQSSLVIMYTGKGSNFGNIIQSIQIDFTK